MYFFRQTRSSRNVTHHHNFEIQNALVSKRTGCRFRPISYRVIKCPSCYSSLLRHGSRLKCTNRTPHQAKQRLKCTNALPPWEGKRKNELIPNSVKQGRESKPPQCPTHVPCFPELRVEGLQELFRERITSRLYRILWIGYENIRYIGG